MSHLCFIDESGDFAGLSSADARAQPTLAVVGLIVPEGALARMEKDFLHLRRTSEFLKSRRGLLGRAGFPPEDKGHDVFRWALRSAGIDRRTGEPWRSGALSVLGEALGLLERAGARVAGSIHVKPVDEEFDGARAYVSSVLSVAANFHRVLRAGQPEEAEERTRLRGRIVCDNQEQARRAARRVFRRRNFRAPDFVDSEKHAGVQLADWLCSAIVVPLASAVCFGEGDLPGSRHIDAGYLSLKEGGDSPWARLARMQFPFRDDAGRRRPGILVSPEKFRPLLFPASRPADKRR